MKQFVESFKKDSTSWAQHVTGDHVVTICEIEKGLDGSLDDFIVTDLFSGLRVAYPASDKSV